MNTIIFSQNVFHTNVKNLNHKKIFKELKKLDYKQVGSQVEPYFDTRQYITTTVDILDRLPSGKELKLEMENQIKLAVESFGYQINDILICNSWATKMKPGNYSDWHSHNNFWLSLVYYPHGNFTISFHKPKMDYFLVPIKERNSLNNNLYTFFVKEGDMLIFPAYLEHKIGYNDTKMDRYSMALNILPRGTIGEGDGILTIA
jgi:uncharacterized protein (TIGR02466 family)